MYKYMILLDYPQVLPIVVVITLGLLVYLLGFRKPVQPPSFEELEDDEKKSKRKKGKEGPRSKRVLSIPGEKNETPKKEKSKKGDVKVKTPTSSPPVKAPTPQKEQVKKPEKARKSLYKAESKMETLDSTEPVINDDAGIWICQKSKKERKQMKRKSDHDIHELTGKSSEDEAAKKSSEDEAFKKSSEDEAFKKSSEDEAAKKSSEDEAAKKGSEDELLKKSLDNERLKNNFKKDLVKKKPGGQPKKEFLDMSKQKGGMKNKSNEHHTVNDLFSKTTDETEKNKNISAHNSPKISDAVIASNVCHKVENTTVPAEIGSDKTIAKKSGAKKKKKKSSPNDQKDGANLTMPMIDAITSTDIKDTLNQVTLAMSNKIVDDNSKPEMSQMEEWHVTKKRKNKKQLIDENEKDLPSDFDNFESCDHNSSPQLHDNTESPDCDSWIVCDQMKSYNLDSSSADISSFNLSLDNLDNSRIFNVYSNQFLVSEDDDSMNCDISSSSKAISGIDHPTFSESVESDKEKPSKKKKKKKKIPNSVEIKNENISSATSIFPDQSSGAFSHVGTKNVPSDKSFASDNDIISSVVPVISSKGDNFIEKTPPNLNLQSSKLPPSKGLKKKLEGCAKVADNSLYFPNDHLREATPEISKEVTSSDKCSLPNSTLIEARFQEVHGNQGLIANECQDSGQDLKANSKKKKRVRKDH